MNQNQTTTPRSNPKHLTYSEIEPIVEYLVKVKSNNYTFDCWTTDDIGQEIRMICFKAMTHFDSERVLPDKWKNFFGRCVDNALKNLKRDRYIRYQTPCDSECELLHSNDDELNKICKKWLKHQENINRKKSIRHPVSIDLVGDIRDVKFEKKVEVEDTKTYLLSKIEAYLRPGLVQILNGNKKKVPVRDRRKIQISVRTLLEG